MPRTRPLSEHRNNAFADGAARFAEIARTVKAQQIAEHQGTGQAFEPSVTPPDEIWARNYASRGIGPAGLETLAALAPQARLPRLAPDPAALRECQRGAEFVRKAVIAPSPRLLEEGAPMGLRLRAEGPPRRSWFARLFGRA